MPEMTGPAAPRSRLLRLELIKDCLEEALADGPRPPTKHRLERALRATRIEIAATEEKENDDVSMQSRLDRAGRPADRSRASVARDRDEAARNASGDDLHLPELRREADAEQVGGGVSLAPPEPLEVSDERRSPDGDGQSEVDRSGERAAAAAVEHKQPQNADYGTMRSTVQSDQQTANASMGAAGKPQTVSAGGRAGREHGEPQQRRPRHGAGSEPADAHTQPARAAGGGIGPAQLGDLPRYTLRVGNGNADVSMVNGPYHLLGAANEQWIRLSDLERLLAAAPGGRGGAPE